jgi:putative membrane protein
MKRAENFFTEEEQTRIKAAVQACEARTSGEVVPVIVDAAYDYPKAEIIGGGSFAIGLALFANWFYVGASHWVFPAALLVLYYPCLLLIRYFPGLKHALISPVEFDAEVREKALVTFVEHGIYRTRGGSGILILISLFEHRVFVLADAGINERVPLHTWEEIVATVTHGIVEGHACDALCQAIARCGDLLAHEFPRQDDDHNELPDLIIGGRPRH